MRSRVVAIVVLVSLLSGCARVREIDIDAGASRLAEITAAAEGRGVTVELASGKSQSGAKLDVGPVTTCWTEWDRSEEVTERVCVPTAEVRRVNVHRRVKGGLVGAGVGVGAGALAVVLPLAYLSASGELGVDSHHGPTVIAAVAVVGLVGGVVGAIVGAVRGKDVYVINPQPSPAR